MARKIGNSMRFTVAKRPRPVKAELKLAAGGFVHIKSDRQMTGEQRRHCALPLCEGTVAPNTL